MAYRREGQGFFSSEARERGKDKHENTLLELKHVYGKLEFASLFSQNQQARIFVE